MSIKFTVIIKKEEDWYVAKCIDNNIASQGKSIDEAIYNLKEALELYYEDETPEELIEQVYITTLEVAI